MMAHPVGTGPYKITFWKRGSRIVLEKNRVSAKTTGTPEAPADDKGAQEIVARMKGKRIPLIDRIEISPWKKRSRAGWRFERRTRLLRSRVAGLHVSGGVGNGIALALAKRGIQLDRSARFGNHHRISAWSIRW